MLFNRVVLVAFVGLVGLLGRVDRVNFVSLVGSFVRKGQCRCFRRCDLGGVIVAFRQTRKGRGT